MARLASRDELITALDLGGDNPARIKAPERLDMLLDSAEKTVFLIANRQFWPEPELDEDGLDTNDPVLKTFRIRNNPYRGNSPNSIRLRVPDLREADSVMVDGSALTQGLDWDYQLYEGDEPFTSIYLFRQYIHHSMYATVSITGRWGFLETPDDVKDAVIQIAARRYHRMAAMYADQIDTGTGVFDFRGGVHPDIQGTLRRYRPLQVSLV